MSKADLTIVIIVRDEAQNLRYLLPSLDWAARVIVLGNHCLDESETVAKQLGADWRKSESESFAAFRNEILPDITTEWVFYLDADERVTAKLRAEIEQKLVNSAGVAAYRLQRQDYHYGTLMRYGGWQNDLVTRIFRRSCLQGWHGEIHESPDFEGRAETLHAPLLHFTQRDTATNLAKSSRWTIKEARLLAAAGVKVTKLTIIRKMVMEFYRRFWRDQGWRDGMAGFVEALVQACNRAFVYIQVWELSQKPTIEQKYQALEEKVNLPGKAA